jgi:hypothetical protein
MEAAVRSLGFVKGIITSISIARSAVHDPKLCRLYRSNAEMRAAYDRQPPSAPKPY